MPARDAHAPNADLNAISEAAGHEPGGFVFGRESMPRMLRRVIVIWSAFD
jgi:hypothetical protein